MKLLLASRFIFSLYTVLILTANTFAEKPQYETGQIKIAAATAEEPIRKTVSISAARDYLAKGSQALTEERKCVSCHTNGTFMQLAPSFGTLFSNQIESHREFFLSA